MSEDEPKQIIPRPEDILTFSEAKLIQQADRGELPCLSCGEPLQAEKVISEFYEGVILFCPDGQCGYVEL
jgi:hypothetical protein